MYYYHHKGAVLASFEPQSAFGPEISPAADSRIFFLVHGDAKLGRGSFKVSHPGQLTNPHGLENLDASRLESPEVDEAVAAAIAEGRLTAVNVDRIGWEKVLTWNPGKAKKRVNMLAIGDVGSTLLTGLKLLGGDVIESIGICDLSEQITARWEFEMGQISLPWVYDSMPEVHVVTPENLFDCDMFVFVAS